MRNQNVYKIGMTKQPMSLKIGRFDGYKKGSELIIVTECPITKIEQIEAKLKKIFAETFQLHPDGSEYFMGDCREMSKILFLESHAAWTLEVTAEKDKMLHGICHLVNMNVAVTVSRDAQKTQDLADQKKLEADVAAEEAALVEQRESQIKQWISEKLKMNPTGMLRQVQWYTNY